MTNPERKTSFETKGTNSNSKDLLVGALIGGVVGAATALFLAPKSGKELRSNLNDQATTFKQKSGELKESVIVRSAILAEATKQKTNTLGQAITKQSTELADKVKDLRSQSQKMMTDNSTDAENRFETSNLKADVDYILNHDEEVQRKLEETKRAFDETERQLN